MALMCRAWLLQLRHHQHRLRMSGGDSFCRWGSLSGDSCFLPPAASPAPVAACVHIPHCPVCRGNASHTLIQVARYGVTDGWVWLSVGHALQGSQGSQAQVIVSTIAGAGSQEAQSIQNTLQQSVSSGQFANSLRQNGTQTSACCLLMPPAQKQPCTEVGCLSLHVL